jgi:hypothetical protein
MLTEKPRKGQRVAWRMEPDGPLTHHSTVLRIEGDLCWIQPDDGSDAAPFIWWFAREQIYNKLAEITEEPTFNKKPEAVHVEG